MPGALTRPAGTWRQLLLILACAGLAAVSFCRWLQPDESEMQVPVDFPNTWIAAQDDGHPDRLVIIRGRSEPQTPVTRDGTTLFQAYHCLNPACPGHSGHAPYVFAHWDLRPCPRCGSRDPAVIQRHHTPEGEALLARMRQAFAR